MSRQGGYTYIAVLILVFALAMMAQTTWIPRESERLRENEQELLFRGQAYREAIGSYYEAAADAVGRYPRSFDDLLADPRDPGLRHLRQLYQVPFGNGDWTVIPAPDGGMKGVYYDSGDKPQKQARFPAGLGSFADAETYRDWRFEYEPEDE